MFACSKLGALFTLFNYAYTTTELLNALKATTPKILFTTSTTSKFNYEPMFDDLQRQVPGLELIVLLQDASEPRETPECDNGDAAGLMGYEKLITRGAGSRVNLAQLAERIIDTDILNLQFTSGSTGLPKAAALTHHGMINSARYIGLKMEVKHSDIINIPVPLFHAFGLVIGKYYGSTLPATCLGVQSSD